MRIWSIYVGKIFGVELRLHITFLLLLFMVISQTMEAGIGVARALLLFALILAAVLWHEVAHGVAALHAGTKPRQIMLLPIGGIPFNNPQDEPEEKRDLPTELRIAVAGPFANLLVALISGTIIAGIAPELSLFSRPLIHAGHLLRSLVWINAGLAVLNIVPAYPLDGGRVLRVWLMRNSAAGISDAWQAATRKSVNIAQGLAMLLALLGFLNLNMWAMVIAFFIFVSAHMEDRTLLFQNIVDSVRMEEIMLTDFSTLSPADTLHDALHKAVHTLQDDFPVVRGNDLVGIISRNRIVEALRREGNGYVQGFMSRAFEIAEPRDSLATAFRKITKRGLTLIPIVDKERLVGIVTLQNLTRSMGLLAETRRIRQAAE